MKPLKIGDLAKQTGLTVRALRHYDEIGLLSPSLRTLSDHRLYSEKDVQKLQEIMLLQLMGFSLAEIKICLEKKEFPFQDMAKAHLQRIQIAMQSQQALCNRIEAIIEALNHQPAESIDYAIECIKAIVMYEKYYTPAQIETLKKRQNALSKEEMENYQAEWEAVFKEFAEVFNAGFPVTHKDAVALGKRANALILAFTGGDPEMEKSLQNMYATEGGHNVLSGHGMNISAELFQFIAKAMGEAKKSNH
ncbi:MAG: MerR family transcriptional regulator [Proteobacteria bacterium]|nr:MerR family transcriptional regulator [Pseudomonadota bacterium]